MEHFQRRRRPGAHPGDGLTQAQDPFWAKLKGQTLLPSIPREVLQTWRAAGLHAQGLEMAVDNYDGISSLAPKSLCALK